MWNSLRGLPLGWTLAWAILATIFPKRRKRGADDKS